MIAPALLVVLILGAIAALLITRDLRRGRNVVNSVKLTHRLVPDERGVERARIRFRLEESEDRAAVEVIDSDDAVARTLARSEPLDAGRHEYRWNGRTDSGALAPRGRYRVRIVLDELDREVVPPGLIRLRPPGQA